MVDAGIDIEEEELVGSVHQRRAARRLKRENSMPRNGAGNRMSPTRARSGRALSPVRGKSRRDVSPLRAMSHRNNSPLMARSSHGALQSSEEFSPPPQRVSNITPKAAAVAAAAATPQKPASLELSVELLQGKGLAACDTNIFGKETTSDPYVIVSILTQDDKEIKIGKTKHIPTTLNPKWNTTVSKVIPPGSIPGTTYTLQLTIMDYDMIGDDDCMGIVKIPMTLEATSKGSNWYEIPKDSAEKAKGKIQVGVESKLHYDMGSFLGNKPATPASVQQPQEEEEEEEPQEGLGGLKSMLQTNAKGLLGVGKLVGTTALGAGMAVGSTALEAGTTVVSTTTNVGISAAGAVVGADNVKMVTDKVKEVGDVATNATTAVGGFIKDKLFDEDTSSNSEKEQDEMEDIYKEEESLELKLEVIKGDGLAPKDKNFIGRNVSSDPYVIVEVWPKGVPLEDGPPKGKPVTVGRSKTINKSLNPVWKHKFDTCYVPIKKLDMEEAQLRIRIYDDDFGLGDDDPMGNIDIFLQPKKHMDIKDKWYHVSATSASGASGRVQLSWETNQMLHRRVIGQRKKVKQVVQMPEPEEVEMSASMPARLADDHDQLMQAAIIAQNMRNTFIHASVQPREKRRMRRTASVPEGEEKDRRRNRRGPSSRPSDRPSSKRPGSSRRIAGDGSKQRSSSRRELGDKHKSSRTRRASHMDAPQSDKTKKSIRQTRSHLPKDEGDGSHGRSRSADPSSLLKKAGVSSRRTKDKEESRRSKPRRDEGAEGEKKRVSKSGRSGRVKPSSRVKGMDDSGGSLSSRRHEDDGLNESTSSRGGSDGVEEKKARVSSSGDKKLKKKSSRGETSGRKKEGSSRDKPSSRSSRSGAHHSSSKRESKSKRSGDAPRPRSSKGGSEAKKGLLAECEELRASYLEAKPFLATQGSRKAI